MEQCPKQVLQVFQGSLESCIVYTNVCYIVGQLNIFEESATNLMPSLVSVISSDIVQNELMQLMEEVAIKVRD